MILNKPPGAALTVISIVCFGLLACSQTNDNAKVKVAAPSPQPLAAELAPSTIDNLSEYLKSARRIPNSTQWFEIISLPNDVYALWEPGHFEKVNSYLIAGRDKDVLYDTGMGIASIGQAVAELRAQEGLDDKPLMVINSHNHLDHNAGNADFSEAWIIKDEWAVRKLTEGTSGGFEDYWAELTPHPGVVVPAGFDPQNFSTPPFPRENIRYLAEGDWVDLGDRRFQVIHTTAHSPDGLALYDPVNQVFFGGDTFLGDSFLIRDMNLLAEDLARISRLQIMWHYSSHGDQLIEAMQDGRRLVAVRKIINGEGTRGTTHFAGAELPLYELDGVAVILAGDFLTY